MTDDLEALRKAVEAFGRRKNELTPAGKSALANVTFNLKRYAEARELAEPADERGLAVMRNAITHDIEIIERDLTAQKGD